MRNGMAHAANCRQPFGYQWFACVTALMFSCGTWQPLYEPDHGGTQCDGPGLRIEQLKTAWHAANSILGTSEQTMRGTKIFVHDKRTWIDSWGRSIAGMQYMDIIEVGPDYLSLAHEMAHEIEWRQGISDEGAHERWEIDGTQRKIDSYQAWSNDWHNRGEPP